MTRPAPEVAHNAAGPGENESGNLAYAARRRKELERSPVQNTGRTPTQFPHSSRKCPPRQEEPPLPLLPRLPSTGSPRFARRLPFTRRGLRRGLLRPPLRRRRTLGADPVRAARALLALLESLEQVERIVDPAGLDGRLDDVELRPRERSRHGH